MIATGMNRGDRQFFYRCHRFLDRSLACFYAFELLIETSWFLQCDLVSKSGILNLEVLGVTLSDGII